MDMGKRNKISRRDFLKFSGVNLASLSFGNLYRVADWAAGWPYLKLNDLPAPVRDILRLVPKTAVMRNGNLHLLDDYQYSLGGVPLAPTLWNIERSKPVDKLFPDLRWGIVLHWYGDHEYFDKTVKGYLRGFNSIRRIADYETRTSVHFLVGDKKPSVHIDSDEDFYGILQTQCASVSGAPYLASHLNNFYIRSFTGDHYMVNALYKLGLVNATINPVLQDLYEGPKVDPNFRTIAIEITGSDFDDPANDPSNQKIANVLSLVWALMKRYRIRAIDVLGHNEIQLSNSDPGKKFMALIRYLLGVMALVDKDPVLRYQVFSPFMSEDGIPANAVKRYFKFVRDFLVLVGLPENVFDWEIRSKYWFVFDQVSGQAGSKFLMRNSHPPVFSDSAHPGNWYLDPDNHEGIDIYPAGNNNQVVSHSSAVYLVTDGICIFVGENRGFHHGKTAIFRHRQPNGAERLTIYGHLNAVDNIAVGNTYPAGFQLGHIDDLEDGTHSFLHFSSAFGATWDKHLSQNPNVPLSADARWIQRHFLHPEEFLNQLADPSCESQKCLTDGGWITPIRT
jgi:hypothetical protein